MGDIIISSKSYYTEIKATKAILDLPAEPGLYFLWKLMSYTTYFMVSQGARLNKKTYTTRIVVSQIL